MPGVRLFANVAYPFGADVRLPRSEWVGTGTAHVIFRLDALPKVDVILCLDEGRMVALVLRGDVSTRALREIPLRALERCALASLKKSVEYERNDEGRLPRPPHIASSDAQMADTFEQASKVPAARGATRERYLAELAQDYVVLCMTSGSPTKVLADERITSPATIRDHLAEARKRKLLTKPAPGRAGGELTPKAMVLLSRHEKE